MADVPPIEIRRHEGDGHRFEVAKRRPAPPLAGLVRAYVGYTEHASGSVRRLQTPFCGLPLIVSFGPSIRVTDPSAGDGGRLVTSFLAGLFDRPVVTEYSGEQAGVQVDLTPLGAALLLRGVAGEAANRVVDLADATGPDAADLPERLAEAAGWADRFETLDRLLLARLAAARAPPPEVALAWRQIAASRGGVGIGRLAAETGWSRQHLALRLRRELGLGPKTLARIARFEHAAALLAAPAAAAGRADLAASCGYADQAHFNRDFKAFAGCSPGEFLARRMAGGLGVAA